MLWFCATGSWVRGQVRQAGEELRCCQARDVGDQGSSQGADGWVSINVFECCKNVKWDVISQSEKNCKLFVFHPKDKGWGLNLSLYYQEIPKFLVSNSLNSNLTCSSRAKLPTGGEGGGCIAQRLNTCVSPSSPSIPEIFSDEKFSMLLRLINGPC